MRFISFDLTTADIDWQYWQNLIEKNGITIDRPYHTSHPNYPEIIYPIDYGYINNTIGEDGVEVDIFVGETNNGLVGVLATVDYRKKDKELKFIYNCDPTEIYTINGFINFDRTLMEGKLILRQPMYQLWAHEN